MNHGVQRSLKNSMHSMLSSVVYGQGHPIFNVIS